MSLVHTIAQQLTRYNATLSTAESCTGGLIGHMLTNVSGSSAWYEGGVVSYSNAVKMGLLGVQALTLEQVGAVSGDVAEQMAVGAQQTFGTTYAVSVTGIAGPGGGTAEKPVGLTYVGVATPEAVLVQSYVWQGNREENKQQSAIAALELLSSALNARPVPAVGAPVPTIVDVRLKAQGDFTPLAFMWQERTLPITDWGRQWQEGATRYFLVMTGRNSTWELTCNTANGVWMVRQIQQGGAALA